VMTGVKTFFTMVVLMAVAGVGFLIVHGNVPVSRNPNTDSLELIITFKPTFRDDAVKITYGAVGATSVVEYAKDSPWHRTMIVPKGSKVVLAGLQNEAGELTCQIVRNGKSGKVDTTHRAVGVVCVSQ
jgi:hypothetical protein